jgi:uncharacterized protein YbjT (DUF2867 family)
MIGMTNINKTVVVLGATGQQGGSVAAALRADGWAVRAVVRDPLTGPGAGLLEEALRSAGTGVTLR